MRMLRVVALAAVLGLCREATADVLLEVHLKHVYEDEAIERELERRSTPGAPLYQRYLPRAEVAELHRPRPKAEAAVGAFLAATPGATVRRWFGARDAVSLRVEAGSAAAHAFGLTGNENAKEAGEKVVTPHTIAEHVENVYAPRLLPKIHARGGAARPDAESTSSLYPSFVGMDQNPNTIGARYNVSVSTPVSPNATQGVAEFQPMGFSQRGMDTFTSHYNLSRVPILVHGANPSKSSSNKDWGASEGQLDIEYISAMATNATTWWVSGGEYTTWAEWCDEIFFLDPFPQVLSVSWGIGEQSYTLLPDPILHIMPWEMYWGEKGFRKLGLSGISVMVSSGDSGPSTWDSSCGHLFGPQYPASSQYVTTVGVTYSQDSTGPEIGVQWSGGGFSEFVKMPGWQKTAVEAYLAADHEGMPPATMYYNKGRAYPDVAALGTNFAVAGTGSRYDDQTSSILWSNVAGTSASAPTFAGIITRIVSKRQEQGKGGLGPLNPTLYSLGKVGQDVTQGASTNNCNTADGGYGFPTAVGWDPVTGLGTPDYNYLLSQLL